MSTFLTFQTVAQDHRVVICIRIVVHTLGPAGPTMSDNHWSIYLLLANDQGSIRMNMRANPEEVTGILSWSHQAYLLTTSALRHWDFPIFQSVQVRQVASALYQSGRHRYDMSGGGSGCRYWV